MKHRRDVDKSGYYRATRSTARKYRRIGAMTEEAMILERPSITRGDCANYPDVTFVPIVSVLENDKSPDVGAGSSRGAGRQTRSGAYVSRALPIIEACCTERAVICHVPIVR